MSTSALLPCQLHANDTPVRLRLARQIHVIRPSSVIRLEPISAGHLGQAPGVRIWLTSGDFLFSATQREPDEIDAEIERLVAMFWPSLA